MLHRFEKDASLMKKNTIDSCSFDSASFPFISGIVTNMSKHPSSVQRHRRWSIGNKKKFHVFLEDQSWSRKFTFICNKKKMVYASRRGRLGGREGEKKEWEIWNNIFTIHHDQWKHPRIPHHREWSWHRWRFAHSQTWQDPPKYGYLHNQPSHWSWPWRTLR